MQEELRRMELEESEMMHRLKDIQGHQQVDYHPT
jgi:hypothetical protein